nr:salicylic acid methyltransferase [Magnolia x soulangeana]
MKVEQVLHMNGGIEDNSYAKNSFLQRKVISIMKPMIEEALLHAYCNTFPHSMGIADLGCSSGPNTLMVISKIVDTIAGNCDRLNRPLPELRVYLNDLPGNDFNTVFRSLPAFYEKLKEEKGDEFGPCFIGGVPGSFYGRLFAQKSLHFIHSSYSLMWLSKVPAGLERENGVALNKGNIFMAKTSPPIVLKAYLEQFQKDFLTFLKARAEEMIGGGRMVLTLLGRKSADPSSKECCYIWELLAQALNDIASQGLIEEEKVDSFNLPQYTPSPQELDELIQKEGSFILHRLQVSQVKWNIEDEVDDGFALGRGQKVAQYMRAVAEPLIAAHFGEAILDVLFKRYSEIVSEQMKTGETKFTNVSISMERKGDEDLCI